NPDRLVLAVVADQGEDRAEDLLARDRHVVRHVGEDRRLEVEAARPVGRPPPADDDLRALALAGPDVALDALEPATRDEGAELRRLVERIADDPLLCSHA